MEANSLKLNVIRLAQVILTLPDPLTYKEDEYKWAIVTSNSMSVVTFVKKNGNWQLVMDAKVKKTLPKKEKRDIIWLDEYMNL